MNRNPWGIFEAEWMENSSDGFDRKTTGFLTCVIASGYCV